MKKEERKSIGLALFLLGIVISITHFFEIVNNTQPLIALAISIAGFMYLIYPCEKE